MRERRATGTRRNLGTGPSNKLKLTGRQGRAGEDRSQKPSALRRQGPKEFICVTNH